ncbi:MAG: alpha/beta fold hydrolase, partial [Myxococcota bacterium]
MSELKTWFHTPPTTGESRLRLFCFPYAGGSASIFHHWPKTLASGIEVYALNLPGRAYRMREKPFTRMPQLVEAVAAAIKPALDVPFVLFGHSLGALMAFEVARALRAHQLPQPAGLIVSARVGPQFGPSEEPIYSLPRNAFVSELQRRYGPTVDLFKNPEVLDLVLPALRSDFEVLDHYVYSE